MADTRLTHRGHEIIFGGKEEAPTMSIDGEELNVSRIAPSLYATLILPHRNFTSLETLAKAIIDHSPAFHGRRDK